jgi:dTDP-4-amino-4,6-dideoxygalactose transaminase
LNTHGIGARAYYRVPSHAQPAFGLNLKLPGTDVAAREHVALPVSATITRDQVEEVAGAVRDAGLG